MRNTGSIWIVFGNLQTQGQKLHHAAFINFLELVIFCGKHQRWRMSEIYEPKMAVRMDFAVKHAGNFASVLFLASS